MQPAPGQLPLAQAAGVCTSRMLLLLGFNAAIGGFLFGYDTGSMSASLLQVKRERIVGDPCPGLTDHTLGLTEQGMVVSFVVLGAFLSAASAGWLNWHFGRRRVLLGGSLFFVVGALMMASAMSMGSMLVARIILGLGVGLSSHTVPLYIAECAPTHLRGSFCFLNDMMIVVGQVTAAAVSTAFVRGEVVNGWRWILGLAALPSVLMFVGFFFMPESPRWLLSKNKKDQAKQVLLVLRDATDVAAVEQEFEEFVEGVRLEQPTTSSGEATFTSIYRSYQKDVRVRRALLLGCTLQALQQLSGINTIMYYGASVVKVAGPGTEGTYCFSEAYTSDVAVTVLFGGAQMCGVISSWFMVDRVGRRPLALVSSALVAFALAATAGAFSVEQVSKATVVALVVLYLISFGLGLSPVPWTVNAEIYPLHVRAQCISIATCTNWFMNFIVSQFFLTLSVSLSTFRHDQGGHPNGVFLLYSAVTVAGLVFLWRHMPETAGLTLEQIGELFVHPD